MVYDKLLKGKTVLLGVSGSIAAYKAVSLTSILLKMGADVHVIMTENATKFISPLTFSTYTGNKTLVDTFDENFEYKVEHISIAKLADIVIIAPATANIIAKLSHGIADDMLSTTILATKAPIIVAPAMNTNMLNNPATIDNLNILKGRNMKIIEPDTGELACDTVGEGKLPEPEVLAEHVVHSIAREKLLKGKRVLVTAGPTREAIDPVRFISNHSTGKMGYAMAEAAAMLGAEVVLISGPVNIKSGINIKKIDVISARDMSEAVENYSQGSDIIIMAAAVADFTPQNPAYEKIKKKSVDGANITCKRTVDILTNIGKNKRENQFICGFSMETENVIENSREKLVKKNVDMIVANNLREEGAGFKTDTNIVTVITREDSETLPIMSKQEVSYSILSKIVDIMK